MELLGQHLALVALLWHSVEGCGSVDEVGERSAIDVKSLVTVLFGSIQIAASFVDDAKVYVGPPRA
ncbi:hypothetical protein [Nonomuraea sp. 10N515B]|uniref:hypothetical protein n=1 Tax=Nonomuraea sp. 10N515B TaxID=3457422 RepID=UPI003FCE3BE7